MQNCRVMSNTKKLLSACLLNSGISDSDLKSTDGEASLKFVSRGIHPLPRIQKFFIYSLVFFSSSLLVHKKVRFFSQYLSIRWPFSLANRLILSLFLVDFLERKFDQEGSSRDVPK
jgi:hypothetical protein